MPHGQAGGGSRLPTVPLRSTAARLAAHTQPQRCFDSQPPHGCSPLRCTSRSLLSMRPTTFGLIAPRSLASCLPFVALTHAPCLHAPCLRPPRLPSRCVRKALRERRSCRPHRRLARPPPGATASSDVLVIPGASAFVPHLCSLVIPAGSLDPAPCGGKEHLSVLRSQYRRGIGGGMDRSERDVPRRGEAAMRGCRIKIRCSPALQNIGNSACKRS
jgi:hypothetical protein